MNRGMEMLPNRRHLAKEADALLHSNAIVTVAIDGVAVASPFMEIVEDYPRVCELLAIASELAEVARGEKTPFDPRPHDLFTPLDEKKVPLYDPKNPTYGLLDDIRRVNGLSKKFREAIRGAS